MHKVKPGASYTWEGEAETTFMIMRKEMKMRLLTPFGVFKAPTPPDRMRKQKEPKLQPGFVALPGKYGLESHYHLFQPCKSTTPALL